MMPRPRTVRELRILLGYAGHKALPGELNISELWCTLYRSVRLAMEEHSLWMTAFNVEVDLLDNTVAEYPPWYGREP